ncbi:MAG: hypothetical protein IJ590_04690 [Rickettsiales bacterium]|nr:hypothetical protein [Rickettsiales bacterium]
MNDDKSVKASVKAITMQKIDRVKNSDTLSVKENRPGSERKQLRQGAESERNYIINEAAGGTSEVKISKNYAYRNTIDPKINIHFAFIYGLLKTFGNPTQYQIIVDGEKGKSVASKRLTSFDEVIEWDFSGKMKDYKKILKEKPEEVKKRIADIYNSGYNGEFLSDEPMYGVYKQNPDVIFDQLMKGIFVNLRDRKYNNVMLNNIDKKPRLVDIDLFFEGGYGNAFLFDKMNVYSVMSLSNYINKQSNKEQKKKYYDTLQEYINKYTLDNDKISKLIQNTTEFAFGLELTAEDVINSTYNYLQHGLSETKKKIEYIKWLNNKSFDNSVFTAKELSFYINDKNKSLYKVNENVMEMLLKAFNKQKEAMEQFLKKEKECKEYIGNVVNKYYKLHSIIDKVDRTHLEIEKEGGPKNVINKDNKEQQEKYKKAIASLINNHLGKTDQKNQKKLFWDRKGEGCKDGKLLNTRCFLKSKSGYINKINREYDRLLDSKGMSYTEKLQNLQSFVEKLNEKETRGCCPF